MNFSLRLIIALAMILAVSSCSTLNNGLGGVLDLDTDFLLEFKVDSNINPDENGVSSPLIVRMYELKSDKAFEKADFIDLYEKDEQVLGADVLAKHELKRLTPGEDVSHKYVLAQEARFVGLYAEFSQFQDASYKLVIPVVQNNVIRSKAVVAVSGNQLENYKGN
jgi:type VI secretion system protein VasD